MPELSINNWDKILFYLRSELGIIYLFLSYSCLVEIKNNIIYIAVHEEAKKYLDVNQGINLTNQFFEKYYPITFNIIPWNDNYKIIKDDLDIRAAEIKKTAIDILNNDKIINSLKNNLNLEIELDSIKLKKGEEDV